MQKMCNKSCARTVSLRIVALLLTFQKGSSQNSYPPSSPCSQLVPVTCDSQTPFRTLDGTCNNLKFRHFGASFTQFERLIFPRYEDGVGSPRGGHPSTLPSPRAISTEVHPDVTAKAYDITNMLPVVGQFLDHDFALTSSTAGLSCCGADKLSPQCFNIEVPPNDYFYSQFNVTCLPFTRSLHFCPKELLVREQRNEATSFIDASQVYGSNVRHGNFLREGKGGRLLRNSLDPNFLPTPSDINRRNGPGSVDNNGFYVAGDSRVNEQPALTVIQTVFFREHNRLAAQIHSLRPSWNDEQLYQNARRLVIAQWQKIVYDEFLPSVLGPDTMTSYNLTVSDTFSTYDSSLNPAIINSFAAASYRFGHNMVTGIFNLMDQAYSTSYRLRDAFNNPQFIQANNGQGYNRLLQGLQTQPCQSGDRFVAEDLTNFLFRVPANAFGQDLVARNIQRGRDHGLPPYTQYRELCDLRPLSQWSQRPAEISIESWNQLRSVYGHPNDIDLFSGGLSETVVPGGVTGPTFNCIMAHQFHLLKFGDRHFYTHSGQASSFTSSQLSQLNAIKLGDIICRNSALLRTPLNVFKPASSTNPNIMCNDANKRRFLHSRNFI